MVTILRNMKGFSWLELKSRYLLICSSMNATSFRNRLNIIEGKLKIHHNRLNLLVMLESTLGINFAVLICICFIINGLYLHCLTIKWFFEDITEHLFHFLDDAHTHAVCIKTTNFTQNTSTSFFDEANKTENHVLFKSNYHLTLTEQIINCLYFLYVSIATLFITKIKSDGICCNSMVEYFSSCKSEGNNKNDRTTNRSTSNFISSISESPLNVNINSKHNKNKFYQNIFFGFIFCVLIILILTFTYSIDAFSLQVICEGFFKNNSKMVSDLFSVETFTN